MHVAGDPGRSYGGDVAQYRRGVGDGDAVGLVVGEVDGEGSGDTEGDGSGDTEGDGSGDTEGDGSGDIEGDGPGEGDPVTRSQTESNGLM